MQPSATPVPAAHDRAASRLSTRFLWAALGPARSSAVARATAEAGTADGEGVAAAPAPPAARWAIASDPDRAWGSSRLDTSSSLRPVASCCGARQRWGSGRVINALRIVALRAQAARTITPPKTSLLTRSCCAVGLLKRSVEPSSFSYTFFRDRRAHPLARSMKAASFSSSLRRAVPGSVHVR